MSKNKRGLTIFSIGACGYGLIEVIWRGHTHPSMLCAGGLSFLGLSVIAQRMKKVGILLKSVVGSALITSIEFIFGVIFNIILKKNVWDYSKMPFNIKGQVCILYSFLWMLLCIAAIPFAGKVSLKLQNNANGRQV